MARLMSTVEIDGKVDTEYVRGTKDGSQRLVTAFNVASTGCFRDLFNLRPSMHGL